MSQERVLKKGCPTEKDQLGQTPYTIQHQKCIEMDYERGVKKLLKYKCVFSTPFNKTSRKC